MATKRTQLTRQFLSTSELAELTGFTRETIQRQVRRGEWPGVIGGGAKLYKFRKAAVETKLGLEKGTL